MANKLCSSIKDRSLKSKINYIKQHLYRKGFEQKLLMELLKDLILVKMNIIKWN